MNPLKSRFQLITVLWIVFLDMLGIGIAIPVVSMMMLDMTQPMTIMGQPIASRTVLLGLLIASYSIAQFFGAPIIGNLSDQFGRKKLFLISIGGTFLGYVVFAYGIVIHNLELLFLGRIIDGFTGGNITVAYSTISDISTEKTKTQNFGLIGAAFGLGFILGPFLGGKLSDPSVISWFTYATPFWFAAGLSALALLFVAVGFKETLKQQRHSKVSLLSGLHNMVRAFQMANLRAMFLFVFLGMLGFNFFTQFLGVFLIQKFHYNQSQIGNMFAYIGIMVTLVQAAVTRPVSRRFKPDQVLLVVSFVLAIVFILYVLPDNPLYLYAVIPFVALCNGLRQPNSLTVVSGLADAKSQGEIMGINQSMMSLGQVIPPIVSGYLVTFNVNFPILIAAAMTFLSWIVFLRFSVQRRHAVLHAV